MSLTSAAAGFGARAAAAVDRIVRQDRNMVLPKRIPGAPSWVDPARLPRIRLRDRRAAFPPSAVYTLVRMLRICVSGDDYPGVRTVVEAADRASLAEFGRELFETWRAEGFPGALDWPTHAQALLGDDETARLLGSLIVGSLPLPVAHRALDALAAIGTDAVRGQVAEIATASSAPRLRRRASRMLEFWTSKSPVQ
ncbi:hypothetical protein AB0M45_32320 [Nocardia sp. NPDC051787]|uniref:hypothetical protein n=1 Tax=Nocardia sp. NPDC051787 TaxID=3155415 RepID=UPI0034385A2A